MNFEHTSPFDVADSTVSTFIAPPPVEIPEALIYEMVNGKPIYYRGWREVLKGEKTIEQIMASSLLQSYLAGEVVFQAKSALRQTHHIATNELGVQFRHKDWRAADVAIFPRGSLKVLHDRYSDVVPEIIIEIDTKADLGRDSNFDEYYLEKTKHLLANGVKKVIWIYTKNHKIMYAEAGKRWEVFDTTEDVVVTEAFTFNVEQILKDFETFENQ